MPLGAQTCAVLADRTVRCWGASDPAQLGDGTTTSIDIRDRPGITAAWALVAGPDFTISGTSTGCTLAPPSGTSAAFMIVLTDCSTGAVTQALRQAGQGPVV